MQPLSSGRCQKHWLESFRQTPIVELVDFEHLMGYLDEVVDASEPAGDPHNMKGWYRSELLRDDGAIDRIFRNLREKAKKLVGHEHKAEARNAVSAALRCWGHG